jgi:dipeptidyl aminopeptidase/acylaminoacyl peptidase
MKRERNRVAVWLRMTGITLSFLMSVEGYAQSETRRPLTIDDLLHRESFIGAVPSPDGSWIAVVLQRSWDEPATLNDPGDDNYVCERCDVWLVSRRGDIRRNLTHGARDRSGSWKPQWSPDGQHLAFLSSKGGDNIRVWMWDRNADTTYAVVDRGVDLDADFWGSAAVSHNYPYFWLSNTELLFVATASAEAPWHWLRTTGPESRATHGWALFHAGDSSTASVLDDADDSMGNVGTPAYQFCRVNVVSKQTTFLAQFHSAWMEHTPLLVSPTRDVVAFVATGPSVLPRRDVLIDEYNMIGRHRLGSASLVAGDSVVQWYAIAFKPMVWRNGSSLPFRWSPNHRTLAVVGLTNPQDTSSTAVFAVQPSVDTARPITPRYLEVLDIEWVERGMVVRAVDHRVSSGVESLHSGTSLVSDWWIVDDRGRVAPHNFTYGLPGARDGFLGSTSDGWLVWLDHTSLRAIDPSSRRTRQLTDSSRYRVAALLWPYTSPVIPLRDVVAEIETKSGIITAVLRLSFHPAITLIRAPAKGSFEWWAPNSQYALYRVERAFGEELTVTADSSEAAQDTITHVNVGDAMRFRGGKVMSFRYRAVSGDSLWAKLVLPVNYQAGRRYPLVVNVYAGSGPGKEIDTIGLSEDLLAAHGYAVLTPSMPISGGFNDSMRHANVYSEIGSGVWSAIDYTIELGIVDPKKIGVMGESFGGFSTYALIEQSVQFAAAVSIAGPSDFVSDYGEVSPFGRYGPARWNYFGPWLAEGGQTRFQTQPWTDPQKFVQNSPIFFLDRIRTPLLMIQGDQDGAVVIEQSEEMYTGLSRLGQRVRFVRYWGEGHYPASPADVRHMWREIFQWFDTWLGHYSPPPDTAVSVIPSTSSSTP